MAINSKDEKRMFLKAIGRRLLRGFTRSVPVRGRHRLVRSLGPRLAEQPEMLCLGGLTVELDTRLLAPQTMYYGIYEEHLTNWITRTIRAGDAVIEPGMNVGFITGHLLDRVGPSGVVIAVEPSRSCVEGIRRHNDLTSMPNLRVINAAVADDDGTERFRETPNLVNEGYGCLEAANWSGEHEGRWYDVQTRRVDTLMEEFGIRRLAFLKLDVEGSELRALRGAANALRNRAIDHIMVETYFDFDEEAGDAMRRDIWKLLESHGMRPHRMNRDGRLQPFAIAPGGPRRFMLDVMWSLAQ